MNSIVLLGEEFPPRYGRNAGNKTWPEELEAEPIAQLVLPETVARKAVLRMILFRVEGGFRLYYAKKSPWGDRFFFEGSEFPEKDAPDRLGRILTAGEVRNLQKDLYEIAVMNGALDLQGEEDSALSKEGVPLQV